MTKKDIVDNISSQQINSVKIDTIIVRMVTENVGIITAYTTFTFPSDEKTTTAKNCYQDVYVKRNNRWLAVSAHVTLLSVE